MPARDTYHEIVKAALIRDGWTITHDPYRIAYGTRGVFIDLAAEPRLAAEKQDQKIAVEIKSFLGDSELRSLEQSVGQFVFYRSLMSRVEPDRKLFLAVPEAIYRDVFSEPIVRPVIEDVGIPILTFDPRQESIIRWVT